MKSVEQQAEQTQNFQLSGEIRRLMGLGYDNIRVFYAVAWVMPEAIEFEELRQKAAGTSKYVAFNSEARERLKNLICTVRKEHEIEAARQKHRDDILSTRGSGISLDRVHEERTRRWSFGYSEINKIFGGTKQYDAQHRVTGIEYGAARGKLGLLGGEEGVGKTRCYTALAIKLVEEFNMRVGVYQGEMNAGEYKELVLSICRANGFKPRNLRNLHVFSSEHHEDHCRAIREEKFDWFVWDSFPMLADSGTKAGINDIVFDIKEHLRGQCSGLMICHLNERGQIKGNNHIRYLCDANYYMKLEPEEGPDIFSWSVGKQRQGARGAKAYFRHNGERPELLPAYQPRFVKDEKKKKRR